MTVDGTTYYAASYYGASFYTQAERAERVAQDIAVMQEICAAQEAAQRRHAYWEKFKTSAIVAGVLTVAAVVGPVIGNTFATEGQGEGFGSRVVAAAGFECGTVTEAWSFPLSKERIDFSCANKRTGTMAFVNVGGLDPAGPYALTSSELTQVAEGVTDRLSILSDGAVNLKPVVYDAPASVTKEVKDHRVRRDKGEDCIDSEGDYVTSQVAVDQMPELEGAASVAAFGGTACPVELIEKGTKGSGALGGLAHSYNAGRLIDVYTQGTSEVKDRAAAVRYLIMSTVHEKLHLLGLDHTNEVACGPKDGNHMPGPNKPVDMDAYLNALLADVQHCTYSTYSADVNAMGAGNELPESQRGVAYAREWLTGVQEDFVSLREPSTPGARTLRVSGPGVFELDCRPVGGGDQARKPYSIITSLPKPIRYKVEGLDVDHEFTSLVFDYVKLNETFNIARVYLANDFGDKTLHLMKVGDLFIMQEPLTVTLGDKVFVFQETDPKKGVMAVTVHVKE